MRFSSVIFVIESKFKLLPIAEVEALLLAHEAQLHKFDEWFDPPSVNLTHAYGADSYPAQNKFQQPESENFALRGGFGRGGDHSRGGRHGGARGGSGHFANFQCQVCFKYGHTVSHCHYRYNQKC